ncbi:MAG: FAD-binding protein [Pseudomonadota bacterium]
MNLITKRALLLGTGAVLGGWLGARYSAKNPVLEGTRAIQPTGAEGTLNDASLLSETPIAKHIMVKEDPGDALVEKLRAEMKEAQAEGRPINISAARHTMGGQAIPRDGTAITMETDFFEPDTDQSAYRCSSGLLWSSAIAQMDAIGFSPKVMQSNNDFGIASTYCVNAHGWPVSYSGMGSTVKSLKMLLADGELVTCSRTENADLFNQSMGGYGLTGLITEMDVEMVPNQRLVPTFQEMPGEDYGPAMVKALTDPDVNMAYGRLNVDRGEFFSTALLTTYKPAADQENLPAAGTSGFVSKFAARVFRAQLGNETMKDVRWWVETDLQQMVADGETTRNSLINEPVKTIDDGDPNRTDILHEYFIHPDRFADWVKLCRLVIPGSYQEMLNITLRFVAQDDESWLSYAPTDRIACVMLFSQEMTERGEADMARMTRELIEGTAALGGSYYLPYRLHATQDQFERVYPRAREFAAAKRAIDPGGLFRNALWDTYMAQM